MTFLRIRDWSKHFEDHRTRELKRMKWLPVPNKHDGSGFTELLDHPNGVAHYGVWHLILQIASKCEPRGTLSREGAGGLPTPLTASDLGRMSRGSAAVFEEAIPRLLSIGWIETCEIPRLPAGNPALSCDTVLYCTVPPSGGMQGGANGEIPTVDEAIEQTMTVGIAPDFCRYVYADWSSRGGKDAAGAVVKWLAYVSKRWARERTDWAAGKHKGNSKDAPKIHPGAFPLGYCP